MHAGGEGVDKKYYIHPKYYLSKSPNYKCAISEPDRSRYSDEYLSSVRQRYKNAMDAKRIEVDTSKAIKSGDSIQLHYELASAFLKGSGFVLDLACGSGFGTKMLSADARTVVGVDNDREIIDQARDVYRASGLEFLAADVLNLPYESNSVDAVVAFEIIEHVPPNDLLSEISRVLKPGGVMCLSTPQNSLGHIPATSDHLREFSLEEIRAIVGEWFLLETIIGIKQGAIFFTDDPVGSNTFVVAKKPKGSEATAQ
jgi:ubiquinone/menaquinone biosynthesis C-methylase UbiE